MDTTQRRLSVLMLPWLAHGHISPFLELAKRLAKRNFHIYLCSTPINFTSIKKRVTEEYSLSIELVELHLPSSPELPPHYHTTNGLPPHLMPALKRAFVMSSPGFSNILETLKPDLLIYDYNQPWATAIASGHDIPAVQFLCMGSAFMSFVLHLYVKPGEEFPFPDINVQELHTRRLQIALEYSVNGVNEKDNFLEAAQRSRDIILVKTNREIEGKYLDYFSVLAKKKIVPVGPLVVLQDPTKEKFGGSVHKTPQTSVIAAPEKSYMNGAIHTASVFRTPGVHVTAEQPYSSAGPVDQNPKIMQWLDQKEACSVIFVSFGSEYFLTDEEMEEIAHGLELSMVNFIWIVRFPGGNKVALQDALPEGFLERVGERGMVVDGWAPQAEILQHPNTGSFVSHCGWSSAMESISFGVPVVGVPMQLDQPVNARLLEKVGVAVEVRRDGNGRIQREDIAKVIRRIMVEEEGEEIRRKVRELSDNVRVKEEEYTDGVAEELVLLAGKRN